MIHLGATKRGRLVVEYCGSRSEHISGWNSCAFLCCQALPYTRQTKHMLADLTWPWPEVHLKFIMFNMLIDVKMVVECNWFLVEIQGILGRPKSFPLVRHGPMLVRCGSPLDRTEQRSTKGWLSKVRSTWWFGGAIAKSTFELWQCLQQRSAEIRLDCSIWFHFFIIFICSGFGLFWWWKRIPGWNPGKGIRCGMMAILERGSWQRLRMAWNGLDVFGSSVLTMFCVFQLWGVWQLIQGIQEIPSAAMRRFRQLFASSWDHNWCKSWCFDGSTFSSFKMFSSALPMDFHC